MLSHHNSQIQYYNLCQQNALFTSRIKNGLNSFEQTSVWCVRADLSIRCYWHIRLQLHIADAHVRLNLLSLIFGADQCVNVFGIL